jgi:hypothetical protein
VYFIGPTTRSEAGNFQLLHIIVVHMDTTKLSRLHTLFFQTTDHTYQGVRVRVAPTSGNRNWMGLVSELCGVGSELTHFFDWVGLVFCLVSVTD